METSGYILLLKDTQTISDKFRKREFVLEIAENPEYPQTVQFQLLQAKCELLDSFRVGDAVAVSFNLRGRKWISPQGETKYFNTLEAWKLKKIEQLSPTQPKAPQVIPQAEVKGDQDDLPF